MPESSFMADWQARLTEVGFYGNSAGRWLTALAVFLVALAVLSFVNRVFLKRAARFAQRTASGWDDALVEALTKTRWWFLLIVAAYCGSLSLDLAEKPRTLLQTLAILTLLLQTALWGNVLIAAGVGHYVKRRMQDDPASATLVSMLALVGKIVLFSVLLLLALDNVGIDVTALIAGLGVGGIAVALAVQNILGDVLASLSIVFDKPFVLGDFLVLGSEMGTVEKIGIKTTRLRSLSGEQLVFSNNDLLQSRIRNYKRMYERRIVFTVGVTYQTPRAVLEQIPGMLGEIVQSQQQVRFDRAHFKSLGDSALVFEVVYYVTSPDFNLSMDVQQAINLAIMQRFEELGVEFAYPTQTLFVETAQPQSTGTTSESPA